MQKMKFESPDLTAGNVEKLAALFPGVVTEGRVNFDLLRTMLGDEVYGCEAYEFTWPGKRDAIMEAGRPSRNTLRPCVEESRDWDTTENIYIEGDNLEVLKLLQESYLGKVKMIYIDPPYNTGNDFIYRDDYSDTDAEYSDKIGAINKNIGGVQLFQNLETNGRFHSDWCSMIYPRLVLARSLLRDDGVIFISIDDHEVDNLRKICDEIFGESNFITEFIWAAGRKNDSKLVSVSHEYILCYAKSRLYLHERQILWRERKQGLDEIYSAYKKIKTQFGTDYDGMTQALKEWFKSLPQTHPAKNHAHYSYVDKRGIYFPDNASWPGGGGPRYEVLHPVTQKPVKVPSRGWIFSSPQKMQEMIADDRIHFGADENSVPCTKSYLTEREYTAPYSVFYKDGRASTKRLRNLLEANVFENPKDEEIIQHIIEFVGSGNGIILDFFSGSGTTAHATLLQNAADGGKRKFIMVQLPEPCGEKTEAYKAGYKNICEIGKERICRAGDKIKSEAGDAAADLDIGFRVLKIDSSNMTDVYYAPADYSQDLVAQMEDNIKADRTDMDLLFACLIDWGLPLSLPHTRESVDGCTIHNYNDGALVACFDKNISETVIRHVAGIHPLRAVFRDNGFTSAPEKINVFELFKRLSPNTSIRVL